MFFSECVVYRFSVVSIISPELHISFHLKTSLITGKGTNPGNLKTILFRI
jgi:hypothetical protein